MHRLCRKKAEIVENLVNSCETFAQREYKIQHNNVAKKVNSDHSKKNGLEHTEQWYEHVLERAVENDEVKMSRHVNNQCDNVIEARRPDIILIDKKERKRIIIDTAVPANVRGGEK